MSYFKLKHSLKNKSMLLTFLIGCSLLISGNALARYTKEHCCVFGISPNIDYIEIYFKFFEYEKEHGLKNSYLVDFKVEYSTDNSVTYTHLLSASTLNQTSRTWAWIDFNYKNSFERIEVHMLPNNDSEFSSMLYWKYGILRYKATVEPNSFHVFGDIRWYPKKIAFDITHIAITAIWYDHKHKRTQRAPMIYDMRILP